MRFVATKDNASASTYENRGNKRVNQKNGSLYITLSQLIDVFYTSRFNRDSLHSLVEGEDIDNSIKHRLYNKRDLKELMPLFIEFLEWVINEKNLGKIYLSKDLTLVRESTLPSLRYTTKFDEKAFKRNKEGEYYISTGKYRWMMYVTGDTFAKMKELWLKDPQFEEIIKELTPKMEEKNKNAKPKDPDKPTE